jgi:hypothetical protein
MESSKLGKSANIRMGKVALIVIDVKTTSNPAWSSYLWAPFTKAFPKREFKGQCRFI